MVVLLILALVNESANHSFRWVRAGGYSIGV
jgi:hypothetical protein